jgi:glycosyltransferase involved in cell wall biosynthesis
VSRAELGQFSRAGIDGERVHLVYNGLDLGEFESLPPRGSFRSEQGLGERPLVLYLGKLTPRKGVDHLLAAMARRPGGDAVLVVAGNDMGVETSLRSLAADLEIGDRVRWVGLLDGPRRLAALADADVLVYPSSDEVFGLVPFEGLLCGTPAVVSDDCGCGQLVAQARAGELVRHGDPAGLARAIDSLIRDSARRQRMVQRGRDFVRQHFGWPRIAEQTAAVYEAALGDRRRSGTARAGG